LKFYLCKGPEKNPEKTEGEMAFRFVLDAKRKNYARPGKKILDRVGAATLDII
jgi:hypothetical protein